MRSTQWLDVMDLRIAVTIGQFNCHSTYPTLECIDMFESASQRSISQNTIRLDRMTLCESWFCYIDRAVGVNNGPFLLATLDWTVLVIHQIVYVEGVLIPSIGLRTPDGPRLRT